MKKTLLVFAFAQFALTAAADPICSNANEPWNDAWNGSRCITVGAGAAVAAGSGIYSAKKYSEANSIVKLYTQRVFVDNQDSGKVFSNANRATAGFTNGDRITISYNLSEAENRQHHIELMKSNASNARASAASYGALALTATKTVQVSTGIDSNGNATYTTRVEPDYAARASYAVMASHSLTEASDYDRQAAEARAGGPVPTYDFTKVVDNKASTAEISSDFIQERITKGGKIISIDRLPVENFNMVKSSVGIARAGLVGVAIGAGFAIEEGVAGMAATQLDKHTGYSPQMANYGSQ